MLGVQGSAATRVCGAELVGAGRKLVDTKQFHIVHGDEPMDAETGKVIGEVVRQVRENFRATNRCKVCGFPIHPSEAVCGECACEEDGL